MAIIRHGSLYNLSVAVASEDREARSSLADLNTISLVLEATRAVQPVPVEFLISDSSRGLALKSVKLTRGFEGILGNLFNKDNEVYFVSWAWDFSGNSPVQHPGPNATPEECVIPLGVGEVREFLGAGVVLFPARKVTAGIAIRIMLWESDKKARNFGKAMTEVTSAIKTSELTNLLSLAAAGTGVAGATMTVVAGAAGELAKTIGAILQANSDDYVDFYEGYYPAADSWGVGDETHQGHSSEITLTRLP